MILLFQRIIFVISNVYFLHMMTVDTFTLNILLDKETFTFHVFFVTVTLTVRQASDRIEKYCYSQNIKN